MKIALFQMRMSDSICQNLSKVLRAIRSASENGADIILFPELQFCPFFPQYEKQDASAYVMTVDSFAVNEIRAACKKWNIMAAPNIFLDENGSMYDATLLIDNKGNILGSQKMVHIAQAEDFYEQDYYTPSDSGFKIFDTSLGKIGIVVCFDRHYPESIRTEALMGADLILIPTANTKAEDSETFEWEIRIQSFQNSVAVAMCNRTGLEGHMDFSGESIVTGPDGSVILKADDREQIIYAEIDPLYIRETRTSKNYTLLRRKDLYA